MDKFKDVLETKEAWESHELDAYTDYPERRRHPSLEKADAVSSKPKKQNDQIRAVADSYAASKGVKLNHEMPTLKVNSEKAGKIAEAYHAMPHEPNHPKVKESYDALINETAEQFNHIKNAGLKISKIKPGMENPYKTSADLHADLKDNHHMWYYPTESGFGTEEAGSDHPMLRDTGHHDEEGKPLLANDMFRVVHDYFGHGKEGFGFGSAGEENAWAHHKQMYSPTAHAALTTETRGQNSWVNFGPHGTENRANPKNTVYAQQKAGLMPDFAHGHDHEVALSHDHDGLHKSAELDKSNYGPTSMKLYSPADNARRKAGRTSETVDAAGPNKAVKATAPSAKQQAEHLARESKKKSKANPVKSLSIKEIRAYAKKLGMKATARRKKKVQPMAASEIYKSEDLANAQVYMAYDGDNAGRLVGRAILADDPQQLHDASNRIAHGHDIVSDWVKHHGGTVISGGGDEGTFVIPPHAVEDIEKLRADYKYATQLTMTVGVGQSLSQAGKALMVGKFRGKDQVCTYDQSIDKELQAAKDHVAGGQGTDEEKKLSEAYLTPEGGTDMNNRPRHDEPAAPMAEAESVVPTSNEPHDCEYCTELAEGGVTDEDHCGYCHGEESEDESEPHCEYCAEAEQAQAQDHEHSGDDCEYCQEAEANAQQTHEHSEENCQYCAEAAAHDPNAEGHEADCQYCAEAAANAQPDGAIDGPGDMPGTEMQDNVSHPADYGDQEAGPTDMGMAEDDVPQGGPDLSQVLQGGLDNHADSIAREKVVAMVSEALEGFKACKPIIERSQEQAPQLYASSIAMLRAMIEMAKMLGLAPKEEQAQDAMPGDEAPQQQAATASNPQYPQSNPQEDESAGKPVG